MTHKHVTISLSNRTIIRVILWVVATILIFRLVHKVGHVLTLIFASFFFALALAPVVTWMTRRLKIDSRVRATAAAYVVVVAVIVGFFALVTPPLVSQTRSFIKEVPSLVDNYQKKDNSLARAARRYHLDEKISKSAKDFSKNYGNFGSTVLDTGKRIAGIVTSLLIVLVMTFMMLVEGPYWLDFIWGLTPAADRPRYKRMAAQMYKGVSGFVNGQVVISLLAGAFSFIALEIASHIVGVGINAAALAGIVSVFGLIPLFGNPISSTIVILFCLLNSLSLAIVMLIYFVIYFFIENHTFQPYIQSRLNKLTALSVFVSALIGVELGGFLGAIVAIPAASALKVILEDQIDRRSLRNPPKDVQISSV